MAVFLVRHAKNFSKEEDIEQGLSPEGIRDIKKVADVLKEKNFDIRAIKHSGKKRAHETASFLGAALNIKEEMMEGLNPLDDVKDIAKTIEPEDNIMLVGHLPFMERLVSLLILGSTHRTLVNFQNAAVICLDKDNDQNFWYIKWCVFP